MKQRHTVLLALLLAFASVGICSAIEDGWKPAARADGPIMYWNTVTLPDEPTLVPLFRLPPETGDTAYWYNVTSLNEKPVPPRYERQLPTVRIFDVFDANGNGIDDVVATGKEGGFVLVLDAFTDSQRVRPIQLPGGYSPPVSTTNRLNQDLDGDGVADFLATDITGYWIVYGDREEPFMESSIVQATEPAIDAYPNVLNVAVGELDGALYVLQAVERSRERVYYELLLLDSNDVKTRRDTIRTTKVHEVFSPEGAAFQSVIVRSESRWWVLSSSGSASTTALSVRAEELAIVDQPKPISNWSWRWLAGLGKNFGSERYPTVLETSNPIMHVVSNRDEEGGTKHNQVVYYRVKDAATLGLERIGVCQLPVQPINGPVVEAVSLIPDMDNDGLQEVLASSFEVDPETEEWTPFTVLFLTGDRPTTLINEDPKFNAPTCTFTNFEPAIIFNALGRQIAVVSFENETIAPSQLEALPQQPLWAVQGECVKRVR